MFSFLIELRSIHPQKPFHSWRLAVDHFQFASFLLLSTSFSKELNEVEMISILLYLLALYSDPCQMIEHTNSEKVSFALETSGLFSTISSFFTACAWSDMILFEKLHSEEKMGIWNLIDELDISGQNDGFYTASAAIMLCSIARQSMIMRESDVAKKWILNRLLQEKPEIDNESMIYQLQFEKDTQVIPLLTSASEHYPGISSLLERAIENYDTVIQYLEKQIN